MSDFPPGRGMAGWALSGGRTDLGLDSPLTEEARKDSLRNRPCGERPHGRFHLKTSGRARPMGDEQAREEEEVEQAKQELYLFEDGDPPEKLEDWPEGRAKYLTYGGPEGTAG